MPKLNVSKDRLIDISYAPTKPNDISNSLRETMKTNWITIMILAGGLGLAGCEKPTSPTSVSVPPDYDLDVPVPALPFAPKTYACPKTEQALKIDGVLDEAIWQQAAWSDTYQDIEGASKPTPRQETRCKMCWDENFFYVAAELKETDLWATLTERDAIIYYDNDFEVFIDPDGDHHQYYELEINALNTVWDLLLIKPYRDGGPAVHGWDIAGLKTAVSLQGTLNNSSDTDQSWRVEIAIPFKALKEATSASCPPEPGDRWKVNFSRVQWDLLKDPLNKSSYSKRLDPKTHKPLSENNWVWSPQGLIALHYPERWGIVEFRAAGDTNSELPTITDEDLVGEALTQAYYQLRNQQAEGSDLKLTPQKLPDGWSTLILDVRGHDFSVQTHKGNIVYSINQESLLDRKVRP